MAKKNGTWKYENRTNRRNLIGARECMNGLARITHVIVTSVIGTGI